MFSYIDEFLSNPAQMLVVFLLAFPGRILALSAHEFAHAWVANRCGDPTAKNLGRMTLNPLKHLDPLGTIMMLVIGFGWAKPVPVNPRNYRNYRRDDLKVSLAGVTMNAILFLLSMLVLFLWAAAALRRIPLESAAGAAATIARGSYNGASSVFWQEGSGAYYATVQSLMASLPFASDILIAPVFGSIAGYLNQMLGYFAFTNLALCIFNLLPVPPLDGYHVVNDLVLKKNLFADPRTARIASGAMFVLVMSGVVGRVLGWVDTQILSGLGQIFTAALRAMGLS